MYINLIKVWLCNYKQHFCSQIWFLMLQPINSSNFPMLHINRFLPYSKTSVNNWNPKDQAESWSQSQTREQSQQLEPPELSQHVLDTIHEEGSLGSTHTPLHTPPHHSTNILQSSAFLSPWARSLNVPALQGSSVDVMMGMTHAIRQCQLLQNQKWGLPSSVWRSGILDWKKTRTGLDF